MYSPPGSAMGSTGMTARSRVSDRVNHPSRSAIDGIAALVSIMAPNGKLETVNRQLLEYCGRPLFGSRPHPGSDLFHFPHQIFGVGSGQPGGRRTIFIFAASFYPIEGGARPAGQRMNNFCAEKLPMARNGLVAAGHESLLRSHSDLVHPDLH
jgi:hypothetical protein